MMPRRSIVAGLAVAAPLALAGATQTAHAAPHTLGAAGRYIVVLRAGAAQDTSMAQAGVSPDQILARYHAALNGFAATLSARSVTALQKDDDVVSVVPDRRFAAVGTSPIEQIPQVTTRAVRRINAPESSAISGNGRGSVRGVNVAVIDSGIQPDQPDLNVVGGVNCSIDPGGDEDVNGHGTIVAGLIGAKDNAFGIVGVAPGVRLWSVRVLDSAGEADDAQLVCGIDWVTATRLDHNPRNDISVANLSLAGPGQDDGHCGLADRDVIHIAICASTLAGVTYVAAAGNDAADIADVTPAAYREVLTVTGMSDGDGAPGGLTPNPCDGSADDVTASFSNFATSRAALSHLVSASAVCVSSTYIGSNVATDSGTSYAAPAASGAVALCIASKKCAGLRPRQIVAKIARDAKRYNLHHRRYGFVGDPLRPQNGQVFGYLIDVSRY
jgi:subtilisin family serine protease